MRILTALAALLAIDASSTSGGRDAAAPRERAPATSKQSAASSDGETARAVPFQKAWLEPFFASGPLQQAAERFRAGDFAGAEPRLQAGIKRLAKGSPERQPAEYLLALTQMNLSKWAEAGARFEALWKSYPRLSPYHAYYAARCRVRRGDAAGAIEWSARVPQGAVSEAEAVLVRIDALRAQGRWEEAADATTMFLDRFPSGPRRAEAMFRHAEALEKQGKSASEVGPWYRRVWAEAPTETWAERAAERIATLAGAAPAEQGTALRTIAAADWVKRGMGLFDRNRNTDSEAAFTHALNAPGLSPELECQARYHRAQSIWKQRQRGRAAPLFDEAEQACARAGNRDLHAKALYQGARCRASESDAPAALARYARVEAEHPDHSYADDARLRAAEVATEAGDEAGAVKLLSEIPSRYPRGDQLGEALWRLAFRAWRAGNNTDTEHWLDENLRLIKREDVWYAEGRALYWKARVLERTGKTQEAAAFYERAVRDYPLSVYALLALQHLRRDNEAAATKLISELRDGGTPPAWSFEPRPMYGDEAFLRAVELARLGQGVDARRELARLGLLAPEKGSPALRAAGEEPLWITAVLLDRGGVWSASHGIPRYTLTAYRHQYPREAGLLRWRLSYPRAFGELVTRNTRLNGIPPELQLAIMREESAFNPQAESFANALGLTQMLVSTARRFAGGAKITHDTLLEPARNLEVGARFLGFLWKSFSGAAPLAIAGYNAGEGAVQRWLRERGELAMDEFMETIPYDETRNYTKRVLASYFAYSWLYSPSSPVPTIPLTLPGHKPAAATTTTAAPQGKPAGNDLLVGREK